MYSDLKSEEEDSINDADSRYSKPCFNLICGSTEGNGNCHPSSMAGFGHWCISAANLLPELPDNVVQYSLADFGEVKGTVSNRNFWCQHYQYKVSNVSGGVVHPLHHTARHDTLHTLHLDEIFTDRTHQDIMSVRLLSTEYKLLQAFTWSSSLPHSFNVATAIWCLSVLWPL